MPLERPTIEKPRGDIPFDLLTDDLVVGEGDEAPAGSKVTVHYLGVPFRSGEEFGASWNRLANVLRCWMAHAFRSIRGGDT